jgi:hypothetical protein
MVSAMAAEKTPITWTVAPAGFVRGPNTLNTVRTPNSRRTGMACFMAGWKAGAKRNAMPISRRHFSTTASPGSILTPRASRTSALPHLEEMERFPCLATGTPAPATTNAAVVDILKLPWRSPPVPQVSTTTGRPAGWTRVAAARMASAAPAISSTVSPLARRAIKKPAITAGGVAPEKISDTAARASSKVKSDRSSNFDIAAWIMGLSKGLKPYHTNFLPSPEPAPGLDGRRDSI